MSFRGLPNQLALQLQFPCLSSRMQLQEIIPLRHSQEFSATTATRFNGFQIEHVLILKRMVHLPSDTKLLLTKNYSEILFLRNYKFHA